MLQMANWASSVRAAQLQGCRLDKKNVSKCTRDISMSVYMYSSAEALSCILLLAVVGCNGRLWTHVPC